MNDSSAIPPPPPQTTGGGWRWQPPEPEELQRMLPQFVVERLVGRGGMGAVYKGIQSSLDRPVAIKVLPPAIEEQDAAFAERFKNEARLMGRLNHPAIVSVYDFGRTPEGQLYFVMEFVDGTDVQRMIAREGRMPPEHALAVTAHLCDALGYAHKQGIVHRDIKPSNVLIDMEGRVKVADFGLAKLTGGGSTLNAGLTQTGVAMGTPDYVAPEVFTNGGEVDGRADLYAVGVMLYQMLTGDIPRGMFKMPSQKFQSIDPRFDGIVRRALEHDREERYQSSHELRRDLDVILTTPLAVAGQESSAALPKQRPPEAQNTPTPGRTVVTGSRNAVSTLPRHNGPVFEPEDGPVERRPSSSLPYAIAVVLLLGVGGWFIMKQNAPAPDAVARPNSPAPPATPSAGSTPSQPATTGRPAPPSTGPAFTPQTPPTGTASTPERVPTPSRPGTAPSTPPSPPATPAPAVTPAPDPNSGSPGTAPGIETQLATLESQFQGAFEREVNASHAEQVAALGASYLTALDRALAEATKNGRLDEAIALRDEKKRFMTHKFMPSIDPAGLDGAIVRLRGTYRKTEKSYGQQRDATALPLYDRYLGVLASLEKQMLAAGQSTTAAKVRVKHADVLTRRTQRAANVPAGTIPLPPPAATAPKSSANPRSNG